jgi:hypothetical protein
MTRNALRQRYTFFFAAPLLAGHTATAATVLLWAYACRHQLTHAIMHMYPCPDRREQVNNSQACEQQLLHLCAKLLTAVFFPHKQPLHESEKDRASFLCNVHDMVFNSSALYPACFTTSAIISEDRLSVSTVSTLNGFCVSTRQLLISLFASRYGVTLLRQSLQLIFVLNR